MARLEYLDVEDLAPDDRRLLERPINIFRVLAHSPGGLACMVHFGRWIRHESTLAPRLRELAILEVGLRHGCTYEFAHHARIAQDFGVPESAVGQLPRRAAGEPYDLEPLDMLVLDAADQICHGTTIADDTWRALRRALSEREVVELVLVVSHYVQVVRVLDVLEVDIEPEYEDYVELMRGPAGRDARQETSTRRG